MMIAGRRRVARPVAIVGQLPTKRAYGKSLGRRQHRRKLSVCKQVFPQPLNKGGCLIDDSSPIYHVHQSSRKHRARFPCNEPNRDDHCLAQPCRQINDVRKLVFGEVIAEQTPLPTHGRHWRHGWIAHQQAENGSEVAFVHSELPIKCRRRWLRVKRRGDAHPCGSRDRMYTASEGIVSLFVCQGLRMGSCRDSYNVDR